MLKVDALSFDYEDVPLLNQISFTVERGQLLHLRGKNGVGKTTLLKLLAGLLSASAGQIIWDDEFIQHDLAAYQQNLCYIGHKSGLNGLLTLRENYYFGLYEQEKLGCFEHYLQEFDLLRMAEKPCGQLSLGQRRRASLLRLMMTSARLWLLDEPLTSLDKEAATVLMAKISFHLKQQGMVIMTSHQDLPETCFELKEYCL
jgi:heme exporter protein A